MANVPQANSVDNHHRDTLTAAVLAHRLHGRRVGRDKYMARCVCHDDRVASLSIRQVGDRILLYDFGGCDTRDILAKLNLTFASLCGDRPPHARPPVRFREVNWDMKWMSMPRRLALAAVEGGPRPETREQRLKQMYREAAAAYRRLNEHIETHLDWIPLTLEHERQLDELHGALCAIGKGDQ